MLTSNKKTILVSWLIGLGSGLFISGIILIVLIYSSNRIEAPPIAQEEELEIKQSQKSLETNELTIEPPQTEAIQEVEELEAKTVTIEIKETAGAREIARLLVANNIIQDYDEFMDYVLSTDAERSLAHGLKEFPLNADLQTIFEILKP